MPIAQFAALYHLIKSLDKSEKRNFALYCNRLESNSQVNFLQLFTLIDKSKNLNEDRIYKKMSLKNKSQFTNLKRHLYRQILKSLRLLKTEKDANLKIRQDLDFSKILYDKGFYVQSLSILERVKPLARDTSNNLLYFEILEREKTIESRHVTRSRRVKNRVESLITESSKLTGIISSSSLMSNVSIQVQGLYIKFGFAKSPRDIEMYKTYFYSIIPPYYNVKDTFGSRVLWYQSHVWFYHMCLDFHYSYLNAARWIEVFHNKPTMLEVDSDLYIRGLHYLMTNSYYLDRTDRFNHWYDIYTTFRKTHQTDTTILDFIYYSNAQINHRILNNNYVKLDKFVNGITQELIAREGKLDKHRVIIINYKLACLFFYSGNYDTAIEYLSHIIDQERAHLRQDIFCYSRLLHIMAHFNTGNFYLVSNLLPSIKQCFDKYDYNTDTTVAILQFLNKGAKAMNFGIKGEIESTQEKLIQLKQDKFAKISYHYFDFIAWIKSILSNESIGQLKSKEIK